MLLAFLLLFFIGIFIGSFLLVLIDRLPREENVLTDRSRCESCGHVLSPFDLIPVVSFIFLKGKCRYCHAFYGWRYVMVEILTGILFSLTVWYTTSVLLVPIVSVETVLYLLVISSLIVIFFADLWSGIIPDSTVASLFLSGVVLHVLHGSLIPALITGLVACFLFVLLFLITKGKGMGLGDVKYVFAMGVFLGFPATLVALYSAFLTGGCISLILLVLKKKKLMGSTIAFGPFLVIGTIFAAVWGNMIWQWYVGLL